MKTHPMRARIRNDGAGPARVDIYDDIGAGGWFSEGYTPASFAAAIKGLSGPLDIHINSGGGDVADGIAIKNAISAYPGRKRTVVDGLAASIASVIAQAGDERIVEPGAMVMIHDPLTWTEGNADDLRKVADTLDKHGDNLAQQYAARAGGTPEQWRQMMRAEAWYTADEAVTAGLADRVGSASASLPQGVDVEQLAARAPGRIMAALRALPKVRAADAGDDDDGQPCKTCGGSGRLKHPGTGKNSVKCPGCGGSGTYSPDDPDEPGGDDEPEGEPDSGMQDRGRGPRAGRTDVREAELPPATASLDAAAITALRPVFDQWFSGEIARLRAAADVDNSPWDGDKAMANGAASDDPASFYAGICAGRKAGDAGKQDSWALPYKYHPDDPPNAAGVKNALARLPQTEGLTNAAEAKKTLEAAMRVVNPDYEPEDSTDTVFSQRLRQMRAALPALRGEGA
jgi:ATP-dependent protease ClpP protease subunit